MMDDLGPYVRLKRLNKVHFLNPRREEIFIDDIAYGIARINRYQNTIEPHYSVAEHSILMAHYFLKDGYTDLAKQCLIHDAEEYIFGDIAAPIKAFLPDYRALTDKFTAFLAMHFSLSYPFHPSVKLIDQRICMAEQRDLRGHVPETYKVDPLEGVNFQCWDWQTAKSEYLIMFYSLFPNYQDAV